MAICIPALGFLLPWAIVAAVIGPGAMTPERLISMAEIKNMVSVIITL